MTVWQIRLVNAVEKQIDGSAGNILSVDSDAAQRWQIGITPANMVDADVKYLPVRAGLRCAARSSHDKLERH